jgi:hypothetical protein
MKLCVLLTALLAAINSLKQHKDHFQYGINLPNGLLPSQVDILIHIYYVRGGGLPGDSIRFTFIIYK